MTSARIDEAAALRGRDPGAALAIYREHAESLDPSDGGLLAFLERHARADPRFEPLYRAAVENGSGRARCRAAAALAHQAFDRHDFVAAEKHWRLVFQATRGTEPDEWLVACVNLAQTFRVRGRVFECLILSRHAARLAERRGYDKACAVARLHIAGVLSDLEDVERLGPALDAFERALAAAPADERILPLLLLGYRARHRALSGDLDGAIADMRRHGELAARTPGGGPCRIEHRAYLAELLAGHGAPDEALSILDEVDGAGLERTDFQLFRRRVRLRATLAVRGPDAALPLAHELLEALWSSWTRAGNGTVLRYASELGRLLVDRFDLVEDGRHAFDLAARAALARIAEVDRCVRELPGLDEPSPEDDAILADYRERFLAAQGEVLGTVARYLQERAVSAADLVVDDDRVAVCAWCRRVRTAGTRWLPIANYLPGADRIELATGICPACARTRGPAGSAAR